jgi:L-lactate dehydrogenase
MQVAVIGTGNAGNALLHELAINPHIEKILVMSRSEDTATGSIMDVASAHPKHAEKIRYAPYERLSDADIIVSTAGIRLEPGQTAKDVFIPNINISENILKAEYIKDTAIIICLATPVDDITSYIQRKSKLPFNQVLGFGGDLDKNRLDYILHRRHLDTNKAHILGEHGRNAIPVYAGEKYYSDIASEIRGYLSKMTMFSGQPRNLAVGQLLAKLVDSIVNDSKQIHYVCGYHKEYGVYLTWPFSIGRSGILRSENLNPGPQATNDLQTLVSMRKNFFDQKRFAKTVTITALKLS